MRPLTSLLCAETLSQFRVQDYNGALTHQSRGLINNSNACYMHSILQPLAACAPLVNLVNSLRSYADAGQLQDAPLLLTMYGWRVGFSESRLSEQ